MGQVVVYKLAAGADPKAEIYTAVERAKGMRDLGKLLETLLNKARRKYPKRISQLIKYFIDDVRYQVHYEFEGSAGMERYKMKQDPEEILGYDLIAWEDDGTGNIVEIDKGYLELSVRKDSNDADNVHKMNVTIPRRLDVAAGKQVFGYVSTLLTDLPLAGGGQGAKEDYLKGAITFQRCL